jgi:hypothetical protein
MLVVANEPSGCLMSPLSAVEKVLVAFFLFIVLIGGVMVFGYDLRTLACQVSGTLCDRQKEAQRLH